MRGFSRFEQLPPPRVAVGAVGGLLESGGGVTSSPRTGKETRAAKMAAINPEGNKRRCILMFCR